MKKLLLLVMFVSSILFLALGGLSSVRAGVPRMINYQGKLTDALGGPVNIEAELAFAVYTEAAGGGAIWSEVQTVTVTDGIFNVLLGSINPLEPAYFSAAASTYLGVRVGADAEMTPRQEIASGAYALRADSARRSDIADSVSPAARVAILETVYPVGGIYLSTLPANPAEILGFGIWAAFGSGRVLAGFSSGDADFNSSEKIGGAKTHTLSVNEIPSHSHNIVVNYTNNPPGGYDRPIYWGIPAGATTYTYGSSYTGGGAAHNNMPPYITVYIWKRTG